MPDELDIKQLCEQAGVTPRTVHYYIQQGLLPPAGTAGPGARYSVGHLDRLRLIRLLQKEHLPLAEIGRRLRALRDRDVSNLVEEQRTARRVDKGSALDYIRGVLTQAPIPEGSATRRLAPTAPEQQAPVGPPARSQWERMHLDDGLELHVRRPLTREQQRRLERVLSAVREIFGEPDA